MSLGGYQVTTNPQTTSWEKVARKLARGARRVHKLCRLSYMAKDLEEIYRHFDFAEKVSKRGFEP